MRCHLRYRHGLEVGDLKDEHQLQEILKNWRLGRGFKTKTKKSVQADVDSTQRKFILTLKNGDEHKALMEAWYREIIVPQSRVIHQSYEDYRAFLRKYSEKCKATFCWVGLNAESLRRYRERIQKPCGYQL